MKAEFWIASFQTDGNHPCPRTLAVVVEVVAFGNAVAAAIGAAVAAVEVAGSVAGTGVAVAANVGGMVSGTSGVEDGNVAVEDGGHAEAGMRLPEQSSPCSMILSFGIHCHRGC